QEAVPDGAEPRGGQHGAPLLGASGTGAAETRHDAPHQNHRVVQSEEEAVGEESGQNLKRDEQILARHSHGVYCCCAFFQAASFEAPVADALAALMVFPLPRKLQRKVRNIRFMSVLSEALGAVCHSSEHGKHCT
ncbi:unnamed protein product, partial [Tetraodon nigroviridis]